jgi:fumarate hydratase class II
MKKTRNNKKNNQNVKTKKNKINVRYESDIFGDIAIPKNHYWGASTQRSLIHFSISTELMPINFIHCYVLFKKCAAKTNYKLKTLSATL